MLGRSLSPTSTCTVCVFVFVCVCVCVCVFVVLPVVWHNDFSSFFTMQYLYIKKVMVKWSRYRPGVAQGVGRGIALLFHDRGTRRGWVVNITPRPHSTPGKDPVPIVQEAGWASGPVWTGGKSRPHRDSIPDRPARCQSLYQLSYRAHNTYIYTYIITSQLWRLRLKGRSYFWI